MAPSTLHLGPLHIPLFALCAAAGAIAALLLSQVSARLVRLDPGRVWDAALAMMLAALVFSRLLLVVGSWRSLLVAPLVLLGLPSLNDTGILLTAGFMVVYMRWKRMPLLRFLDAIGPSLALVWASFSLGDLAAGTRDGMPSGSRLAVSVGAGIRVHPVEFYAAVAGVVLCGVLLRVLVWLGRRRAAAGLGFAAALMVGGAAIFLLDFLRVPVALYAAAMLDPGQWLALGLMMAGGALLIALPPATQPPNVEANDAPEDHPPLTRGT